MVEIDWDIHLDLHRKLCLNTEYRSCRVLQKLESNGRKYSVDCVLKKTEASGGKVETVDPVELTDLQLWNT